MAARAASTALALLAAASCCACGPHPTASPRAVVVGIDGADWRVIEPLVEQGRMPNLASLRERGTWGPIRTLVDFPLSPVIWTSVATGKTPAEHGITWFLVDRPDGTRVPVRSYNRRVKALWNILAEAGRRTTAVGWWATYPAEDVGDGIIVSDALGFHGFGRTAREGDDGHKTWPPERFAELDALVPPEQQLSGEFVRRFLHVSDEQWRAARFDPAVQARNDPTNPFHLFQEYAVTAQGYTAIAERLLQEPYDLFLVYYEQVDSLSHLFMKYAAPRLDWIDEADHELFKDAVGEWYVYQDELLGRLLAKVDLETTAVFVLSDHGFKSGERRIRSERTVDIDTAHLDHEPDGIFLAAGPGIRSGARVEDAAVTDLTPTLLHYLGLRVGKDMEGKVLAAIFEPGSRWAEAPTYVSTYETGPEGTAPAPPDDYGGAELADATAALGALGYVRQGEGSGEDESSPEIHDNLALLHVRAGELDEAVAEFEEALALNPHDANALLGQSRIAALRGNRPRAEHLAEVALASNPDSPNALAQLADLRRESGDLKDCVRLYRQALDRNDGMPDLYLGLGDCLQRMGRYPEAEETFTRALQLAPDSFAAVYNLGVTAFQEGRTEEAIERYEHALELAPDHPLAPAALNNLGTVHLERGEIDRAVARWEEAVAASPAQFEARVNLALQRVAQGRIDDAIALLEQAARLSPNDELVHVQLARLYLEKQRGEDAYRALTLVHRLYPENWFAPLGLAVLYAATDQPERARGLLEDAFRLGGEAARTTAAGYPALASLLDGQPKAEASGGPEGRVEPGG